MTSSERSKKWRNENPDYWVNKNSERRKRYAAEPEYRAFSLRRATLSRYKISPEQYDAQLAEQGGHCALCSATHGTHRLHMDHDHTCCSKKFTCGKCRRGILCSPCNIRLGALEATLAEASVTAQANTWTERALQYLDTYNAAAFIASIPDLEMHPSYSIISPAGTFGGLHISPYPGPLRTPRFDSGD